MANVPNKAGSTKPVTNKTEVKAVKPNDTEEKVVNSGTSAQIAKENEELKKQMVEMQAQFELMKQMMMNNQNNNNNIYASADDDRYITFINMIPGTLGLKGSVLYAIEGQFNHRDFLKREAKLIVNNMPNTIRDGLVYIADADFVKECKLDYEYEHILSDKQLKDILNQNSNQVVEIYKNANKAQQKIIIDMIVDKKINGVPVDANILVDLGRICGKDLVNIESLKDEDESSK